MVVSAEGPNESKRDAKGCCIIFSYLPDGSEDITIRCLGLTGAKGQSLPDLSWARLVADQARDETLRIWWEKIDAQEAPIWKEYLRYMGPMNWIPAPNPELELTRFILFAADRMVSHSDRLPRGRLCRRADTTLRSALVAREKILPTG